MSAAYAVVPDVDLTLNDSTIDSKLDEYAESRAASVEPYLKKFHQWCEKTGSPFSVATLIAWDQQHNNEKIKSLLGSVDEVLTAGYNTLYNRVFYKYYYRTVQVVPQTIAIGTVMQDQPEESSTRVGASLVRKGIFLPTATLSQRKMNIERAEQQIRDAANRLMLYNQTPAKLKALAGELMTTWHIN